MVDLREWYFYSFGTAEGQRRQMSATYVHVSTQRPGRLMRDRSRIRARNFPDSKIALSLVKTVRCASERHTSKEPAVTRK